MVLRFPELTEPIRFMLSQGSLPTFSSKTSYKVKAADAGGQ